MAVSQCPVASAPVYAELIAAPGRSEASVDSFFEETGIGVDWDLPAAVWRSAGRVFRGYAKAAEGSTIGASCAAWKTPLHGTFMGTGHSRLINGIM
jgi:hypothetical protein